MRRHSAISLHHTRQEGIVALFTSDDCDASLGLCFLGCFCSFKSKRPGAGVQTVLQRINLFSLQTPSAWNEVCQTFRRRQFKVCISHSLPYCPFKKLPMGHVCCKQVLTGPSLQRNQTAAHTADYNSTYLHVYANMQHDASHLTKVSATNMGDFTCAGLKQQVDLILWQGCTKHEFDQTKTMHTSKPSDVITSGMKYPDVTESL